MGIEIRAAGQEDLEAVLDVERAAFGEEEEAELVRAILADPTAAPTISLLAEDAGAPVGHILFSHGEIEPEAGGDPVPVMLLAPLAVVPEAQGRGIGGALIRAGVEAARGLGRGIVLVLGHPGYYPRHGFSTAVAFGVLAPYPIEPVEAFMVLEIEPGALEGVRGRLRPAVSLVDPALWRE